VESFFVNVRRYILPRCHVGYWMGYKAETWPKFTGLDKTLKNNTYSHYGALNMTTKTGSYLIPEPNGKTAGEMCLLANQTQAYGGAFGWADANCQTQQIFMCRIMGAPQGLQSGCTWRAQGCPYPAQPELLGLGAGLTRKPGACCPQRRASSTTSTPTPTAR
jgi:hypothetical protein